ncbi:MAG: hypothetical protein FWG38_05685 [Defluviitaleaceae bacterium]|nr:hypothetical protein [Defluviitaleaceae bacterium]
MPLFFQNLFTTLNQQGNLMIVMVVYLALVALALILRVVAHLHFRAALLAFQLDTRKEIKDKTDVAKLKNGLLRKVAADYIRTAERAVTTIPTKQLVDREVAKMSLLGWRYESILPFVHSLDTGLLVVGLALTIAFSADAFVFGTLTAAAFVLTRLCAAFFNADNARAQLADDIQLYIEREIGRFFASDAGGAVLRLKNDLTESIGKQSADYKETMENIGHIMASAIGKIADSMTESTAAIGPAVAKAMDEKLINMNDTLTGTLQNWEKALGEAAALQNAMNESSEKLSHAAVKLQSSSELLATHMQGHSNALSTQLVALVSAIDAVKASVDHFGAQQEALTAQAKYMESNQKTLETSLHAYEESLKGLTGALGDGLGAFINLHAQTSAQTINDALKSNLDKMKHISRGAGDGQ